MRFSSRLAITLLAEIVRQQGFALVCDLIGYRPSTVSAWLLLQRRPRPQNERAIFELAGRELQAFETEKLTRFCLERQHRWEAHYHVRYPRVRRPRRARCLEAPLPGIRETCEPFEKPFI